MNVTEAQAKLNKLIDRDSFAISRHGKVVGVFLSRDRIEALLESMELLGKPEFASALEDLKSGRMKLYDAEKLDEEMSG